MTERALLRVEEAAEVLGLSRTVTWSLISSGQLRSLKIGKARRITPEAIRELIERRERESEPAAAS